jgi:hypothetical protein
MRYVLIVLWMLVGSMTSANAQVSISIGLPGVSIGINLPVYPELVQVPGYPVYYAPRLNSNYFFYDGMYWIYQGDNWYASSWYNGPWGLVAREVVPLFILRIPVRYYRRPPAYFHGWQRDLPPRWGEHWGAQWEQHRSGWNKWNHASAPRPAPLPVYQRQYSGNRYPQVEQQQVLRSQNYRYQPREAVVRQHYQEQAVQRAPAPAQRVPQATPQQISPTPQTIQRPSPPAPVQQSAPSAPRTQPPQRGSENVQRPAPTQAPTQLRGPVDQGQWQQQPQQKPQPQPQPQPQQQLQQKPQQQPQQKPQQQPQQQQQQSQQKPQQQQPQQGAVQREAQTPRSSQENVPQGKGPAQESGRGQGQENERGKSEERGK